MRLPLPLPLVVTLALVSFALAGPARAQAPDSVGAVPGPAAATSPDSSGVAARAPEALAPEADAYRFPGPRERFADWAVNSFGAFAVAGDMASAAWGQWVTDEPVEWPENGEGLSKRFGAAAATTAITETSFALLSALARQDARYYRCPCTGFGPRLLHAVKMTFSARRPDGRAAFSPAKLVSPFVGPLVTRETLYPERYDLADGALSGAYALAMNVGWNVAFEFVLKGRRW